MNLCLVKGLSPEKRKNFVDDNIAPDEVHFHLDQYFTNKRTGEYIFVPTMLQQAHNWCIREVRKALGDGKSVWVSSEFGRAWEMSEFVKVGRDYGAEINIYRMIDNGVALPKIIPNDVEDYFGEILKMEMC